MQARESATLEELDTPRDVLAFARHQRAVANAAEANILIAAVTWAEQHPVGVDRPGRDLDRSRVRRRHRDRHPARRTRGTPGRGVRHRRARHHPRDLHRLGAQPDRGRARAEVPPPPPLDPHRRPASCLCGGPAGSPKPPSDSPAKPPPSSTPRSRPTPTRSAPPRLDRLVAEAIARFMPAQAAEDAAAGCREPPPQHPPRPRSPSTAPPGSRASSTSATRSTSTPPCTRGADALEGGRLRPSRSTSAARWPPATSPAASSPSTSPARATTTAAFDRLNQRCSRAVHQGPAGRALRAPLRSRHHRQRHRCGLELARVENHRQVVTADQVRTWCANPDTQ